MIFCEVGFVCFIFLDEDLESLRNLLEIISKW